MVPWGSSNHWFWSATQEAGTGTRGIMALFNGSSWEDNNYAPVLCVRGGGTPTPRRFEVAPYGNGAIILDTWTGLAWERCAIGQTWDGTTCVGEAEEQNHTDAKAACESEHLGYGGWRLPNARELRSLRQYCEDKPIIDLSAFPNTTGRFWTDTDHPTNPDNSYIVSFGGAYVSSTNKETGSYKARCVRGCEELQHDGGTYLNCQFSRTWEEARDYCRLFGADLVEVNDEEENYFVYSNAARCWIGANDIDDEGTWVWSNGASWDWETWVAGEPNNNGDEDCAGIWTDGDWNDWSCSNEYDFICEK